MSTWIYDVVLLLAVVLAATQHVLARGAILAVFLLGRVGARLFARGRRTVSVRPARTGRGPQR